MACTGAMWRMLRVGRILICVHTTNKDCLLLLLLLLIFPHIALISFTATQLKGELS